MKRGMKEEKLPGKGNDEFPRAATDFLQLNEMRDQGGKRRQEEGEEEERGGDETTGRTKGEAGKENR